MRRTAVISTRVNRDLDVFHFAELVPVKAGTKDAETAVFYKRKMRCRKCKNCLVKDCRHCAACLYVLFLFSHRFYCFTIIGEPPDGKGTNTQMTNMSGKNVSEKKKRKRNTLVGCCSAQELKNSPFYSKLDFGVGEARIDGIILCTFSSIFQSQPTM